MPPKVFISYRWTNPEHEEWVLALATRLREDGIDAILDKWNLRGGQDTLTFMETMVNDEAVTKVLMICDRGYVERANSRKGGVGTEAQIISAKVYDSVSQTKFGAIVRELDEEGKPYLPNYFSTRLYFDLSNDVAVAANYEEVVRWCFDKPFHVTPPLGKAPTFLAENYEPSTLTVGSVRLGVARDGREMDFESQLRNLAEQVASVELQLLGSEEPDEVIVGEIERSAAFREAAYTAVRNLLRSEKSDVQKVDALHRFFEKSASTLETYSAGPHSPYEKDFQEFLLQDVLIATVAIGIAEGNFQVIGDVLQRPFIYRKHAEHLGEAYSYRRFSPYLKSLNDLRKRRLNLNRISVQADKLRDCHENSSVSFIEFMEADFTLYIRDLVLDTQPDEYTKWYPVSLVFAVRRHGAFPSYLRASSLTYYERFAGLLGNLNPNEIREKLAPFTSGERRALHWDYDYLDIGTLANLEKLGKF